ncbi:von Willebrand factor type A domain-containing protein [Ceratocystis lukuohia]|uniref:VWFA domain-containing protein n=3 Tax=Ceratocystis TaxID=5157 RepID=A0A0F8CT60_CERFI|nr:hypothetical protein CFO_g3720 [Ceratocystis platani]PHH49446.1 26S proteasome non-ATPase regulatory subunit 4 -like protein [Ceratocystis fimbriata CBS 114723]
MGLEAVMIVVDNSESSRNGDFSPSRFDAQTDAVNQLFRNITSSNPESSVGLMSMGGNGPEVLSTLTTEPGRIYSGMHRIKKQIKGESHLATGIQIAGLALKYRQNKLQRQRIIVFLCSPLEEDDKKLQQLASRMKKNNVAIDIVMFGQPDEEAEARLRKFNEEVKGTEGSHLVVIRPSGKLLSDELLTTPIVLGDNATGDRGRAAANEDYGEFTFDPNTDPELALALRMSMEEENARIARESAKEDNAAIKASLESVKEEGESAPLLGESSKKNDKDDGDKMDTS